MDGPPEVEVNQAPTFGLHQALLCIVHLQAMVAVFGYGAQAVITHQGPWANLQAHLADPTHNNILTK